MQAILSRMQMLSPTGPFLLILWDPAQARCLVKGTLTDKELAYEMLARAKRTLDDHYGELAKQALVERPLIQLTDKPA
jgi:hypothetical protein